MDGLLDLLIHTVTIEPLLARDDYGAASYGPGVDYACRIDGSVKQSVNVGGVERSVQAVVFIDGNPSISPADRITMPATFDPQQPPILKVDDLQDESGPDHMEIYIGAAYQRSGA